MPKIGVDIRPKGERYHFICEIDENNIRLIINGVNEKDALANLKSRYRGIKKVISIQRERK